MRDQAERLRQMAQRLRAAFPAGPSAESDSPPDAVATPAARPVPAAPPPVKPRARFVAVTSGKGGVGKTNVAVNLAYALQQMGRTVILLDADLSLANVDVLLGTTPRYHLGHLLAGERTIRQLVYTAPEGLRLIAGGSGLTDLVQVTPEALARFIASMQELEDLADYVLVDTGAGLGPAVQAFTLAADEVLVITTPEPTAITDAYALVKTLVRRQPGTRFSLIVNQAENPQEGREAAERLSATALKFLGTPLTVLGFLPADPQVPRAVRRQTPFLLAHPSCPAARAVQDLARQLAGETAPAPGTFAERLNRFVARWQSRGRELRGER